MSAFSLRDHGFRFALGTLVVAGFAVSGLAQQPAEDPFAPPSINKPATPETKPAIPETKPTQPETDPFAKPIPLPKTEEPKTNEPGPLTPGPATPGPGTGTLGTGGTTMPGGATTGPGPASATINPKLLDGLKLMDDKKYAEAEKYFKTLVEEDPKQASPRKLLALAYRMQNKLDDSLREYDEAIRLQNDDGETFFRRGIVWFYKGEYQIALLDFNEALAFNDHDARIHAWIGYCRVELDDLPKALEAYSRAIKYDPTYSLAYNNRGLANLATGNVASAIADFNQCIRLDSDDPRAYFKRGVAQTMAGEQTAAVASYTAALQYKADFAPALENRAQLYEQQGAKEKAAADRAALKKLQSREELPKPTAKE